MSKKELICIACPSGCQLTYEETKTGDYIIEGNECAKGPIYLKQEVTNPKRMVASTVKINGSSTSVIPVYTDKPIAKEMIDQLMEELNKTVINAPVNYKDIIIENIFQTDVNICVSKTVNS